VILWLEEDEMPPVFPQPVGFWTLNPYAKVGYWQLFGDPPRFCSDRHIRGWRLCLRKRDGCRQVPATRLSLCRASIAQDQQRQRGFMIACWEPYILCTTPKPQGLLNDRLIVGVGRSSPQRSQIVISTGE
jgi:hypothetical protein